jgi:hypothetical protein
VSTPWGDPERAKQQTKLARALRLSRLAALLFVPVAVIAIVDLATGSPIASRRMDAALLAITAMAFYSVLGTRQTSWRFARGEPPQRATRMFWAKWTGSIIGVFGFTAGVGYLVGGWIAAALLPAITVILTGLTGGLAFRHGRRKRALIRNQTP